MKVYLGNTDNDDSILQKSPLYLGISKKIEQMNEDFEKRLNHLRNRLNTSAPDSSIQRLREEGKVRFVRS